MFGDVALVKIFEGVKDWLRLILSTHSALGHGWDQGARCRSTYYKVHLADSGQKNVESLVLDPQRADLFAIVKGARNGFTYGAKIRFPHALVYVLAMATLFGPWVKIRMADNSRAQYGLLVSVWNVRSANPLLRSNDDLDASAA